MAVIAAGLGSAVLAGSAFARDSYHIGLNFLDVTTEIETYPFVEYNHPDWIVDFTYQPALISEQPNIVAGAALSGWTEAEIREAITLAVERAYRTVDTGDPKTTLRIAIHNGPAPTSATGRRLNVIVGHNETAGGFILGRAELDAYADKTEFPDDSYAGVILPPHLDALSGLTLDTPEAVINLIAGTTAHEIGHIYGLEHVDRGPEMPYPIMASGVSGLLNIDRLTLRCFTDELGTQGSGRSSESRLVLTIGTVNVADFNMDEDVDLWQLDGGGDAQILASNLGMTGIARMRDGDANNDGDVDVWQFDGLGDAQLLSESLGLNLDGGTGSVTLPSEGSHHGLEDRLKMPAGTAEAIYNAVTGELRFATGERIGTIGIGSAVMYPEACDPFFAEAPAQADGTTLAFWNPSGDGLPVGEDSVGLVLPPGLTQQDMTFSYTPIGGQTTYVPVAVVPEPSTIAMLAVLGSIGLAGIHVRRRRMRA